jgi:hypothetical protein
MEPASLLRYFIAPVSCPLSCVYVCICRRTRKPCEAWSSRLRRPRKGVCVLWHQAEACEPYEPLRIVLLSALLPHIHV